MTMQLSAAGAAFLRAGEGFVSRYYLDPIKVGTIGIGFTWRSDAFREWWAKHKPGQRFGPGATMTLAEADDALVFLMQRQYGAALNRFLGRDVPQHVFDGASSTVYNCGEGTLDDRWAGQLKAGRYDEAGELLRTTRITADGKRLAGLASRRREEAELIEFGDYTIGQAIDAMTDGILKRGERGADVKALQTDLTALGLYDGLADGVFGYGTEAAVMAFQRSAHLADDGYAGPKTLAAIRKAREPAPADIPRAAELAPPASTAPIAASPRPDLIGRPSAVVERILRDEGSRTIAKANEVIRKTLLNRAATLVPGGGFASILLGLGNVPVWVWIVAGVSIVALGVILFLSWRQSSEATAIKVARIDDAVTGNAAYGGPTQTAAWQGKTTSAMAQ